MHGGGAAQDSKGREKQPCAFVASEMEDQKARRSYGEPFSIRTGYSQTKRK
jgi:hypothetical protein